MKEPILSREEVKALYSKHFVNPYDLLPLWAEAFSAALESAILEKLCGEPIYQTRQLSDEAAHKSHRVSALKTTPTAALREEGNG